MKALKLISNLIVIFIVFVSTNAISAIHYQQHLIKNGQDTIKRVHFKKTKTKSRNIKARTQEQTPKSGTLTGPVLIPKTHPVPPKPKPKPTSQPKP